MDNPNVNANVENTVEWWAAKKDEMLARLEKMDAEQRMEANDAFKNLSEEFDAATNWTEASWDIFKAKVEQWWNEGETKTDETVE